MNFQRIYPAKDRVKLDGGLNTKFDKMLIADNETPAAANVIFDDNAAQTRGGTAKLNTNAVGSFVCDGLFTRHDRSGGQTMVAFFGGTAYGLTGSSFVTIGSSQSIFTMGMDVTAAEQENQIFFGNGGVTPYKYNGAEFTRHGVPAPTSAPSAVSAATGVLTGDYRYKIVYVNSGLVEGNAGASTATFAVTSGTIGLSGIPVAPQSFGVNTRRIYRTEAGGSTWKRVATLNDNTTTTYHDNIADASLGVAAPSDQGEPPNYSFCVYHRGRLFMNDPGNLNYIWYSELDTPYVVKTTNFLSLGDNTQTLVRGAQSYGEHLLVFGDMWAELIYMPSTDPTDWVKVRIQSPYGCRSPFALPLYNNKIMFPALQNGILVGFAAIKGSAVAPDVTLLTTSSMASDQVSGKIEPDVEQIQSGYIGKIRAIVFKNKIYISVTHGSGQTANNRIWVYDFSTNRLEKQQEGAWMPWTGLNPACFTIYDGKLYYGTSTATGFVYEMNRTTYNDDGAAIDSYIWSKEFQGGKGDELYTKDWRYINALLERSGAYNVEVRYRTDSDDGVGNQLLVDVNPGGALWGTLRFGTDSWNAGQNAKEEKVFIGAARGQRIQFKFSNLNTANQKFKIIGFNMGYNLKGKR